MVERRSDGVVLRGACSLLAGLALMVALAPAGTAGPPAKSCPASASGWRQTWQTGNSAPERGEDALWDWATDGLIEEGLTLQDMADKLAGGDIDALYGIVVQRWRAVDADQSGTVCMKEGPDTDAPGILAYVASFMDERAATER
jgi:hypothetical protein